jgi:uncharacterized protein (DUF2384 family)
MRDQPDFDKSMDGVDTEKGSDPTQLSVSRFCAFQDESQRLGLRVQERQRLLGGISIGAYHKWRRNESRPMSDDLLDRVGLALSLLKALRRVHPNPDDAYGWLERPNPEPPFDGRSPLDTVTRGSDADREAVLRHLEDRARGS